MSVNLPLIVFLIVAPVWIAISFASGLWYLGTFAFAVIASLNLILIYRNERVYRLRKQILDDFGVTAYSLMPDYDVMVNDFWIPISKYKQDILLKAGIVAGGGKDD